MTQCSDLHRFLEVLDPSIQAEHIAVMVSWKICIYSISYTYIVLLRGYLFVHKQLNGSMGMWICSWTEDILGRLYVKGSTPTKKHEMWNSSYLTIFMHLNWHVCSISWWTKSFCLFSLLSTIFFLSQSVSVEVATACCQHVSEYFLVPIVGNGERNGHLRAHFISSKTKFLIRILPFGNGQLLPIGY